MKKQEMYITKLNEHVWLLDERHMATGYLVVGAKKAVLIDTMMGLSNLRKHVEKIADLPVTVVNTHGHNDHIFGNAFFGEAYMNPLDNDLAEWMTKGLRYKLYLLKYGLKKPLFKPIKGGDTIDLGGITLEVVDFPGHTPGGILLLLKEDRILFTGDSINRHLWMQLDNSLMLTDLLENLSKVEYLTNEADKICHGHARDFEDISLFFKMKKGIEELVYQKDNSVTDSDPEYKWHGGICKQHPYDNNFGVIVYDKNKLPR